MTVLLLHWGKTWVKMNSYRLNLDARLMRISVIPAFPSVTPDFPHVIPAKAGIQNSSGLTPDLWKVLQ